MKSPFFMCYVDGMGRPKKRHATRESAASECLRLADNHPCRDVHLLAVVHTIKAIPNPMLEVADEIAKIDLVDKVVVNQSQVIQVVVKKKRIAILPE